MRGELPMRSGDEQDAFTSWRRAFNWKPGRLRAIKRGYHRRVRQIVKRQLRDPD